MKKLLIITGPTATGKTKLALKLVKKLKKLKGQIISADSRQVYQGLDIGTGKDKPQKGPTILGYDLVKPDQDFSLAHFVKFANSKIKILWKKNQLPLIVGGTGLYLKALTQPIDTISIKADHKLRQKLNRQSVTKLQTILKNLNPKKFKSLNRSDRLNPRRLIRAIEVVKANSLFDSTQKSSKIQKSKPDVLWIGLTGKKSILDKRIEKRVDQRIKNGAQKEVADLIKKGYSWDLPAFSAMGYKQWQPFFEKQATLDQVRQNWIKAETQYLRRQLTWFKKNPQINWFDINQINYYQNVVKLIKAWYT